MARSLVFRLNGSEYQLEPIKLDRKKLYGWTELIALDECGTECQLATIDETGSLIIPKGGVGSGMIKQSGEWIDKSELVAFSLDGLPAIKHPSSFAAPIELNSLATFEDLLDHSMTSVYLLKGDENYGDLKIVCKTEIYMFQFSFTDSYEPSTGFLVENSGELFILVGEKHDFPPIGLDEAVTIDEDSDDLDNDDELDFGMM